MYKDFQNIVLKIIEKYKPSEILDCPSGDGWLAKRLNYRPVIDGIDLYEKGTEGYRNLEKHDLDNGIPNHFPNYDLIVCCEGIEHIGNPELFLRTAKAHLKSHGKIILTTPNIWYAQSRLQYLVRGFFPSFPCLVGKINKGTHMHIIPWSYPQLYLFCELTGYRNIKLYLEKSVIAEHIHDYIFAIPQKLYCLSKIRKCKTEKEKMFWQQCMSPLSLYGQHLIVIAES